MHIPLFILLQALLIHAKCPYSQDIPLTAPPSLGYTAKELDEYASALAAIDFDSVKKDIVTLLTDSQDFWPADYGNYGPFFVRQAWHCAGSYRISDGRGGCDGGRQRFDPERSWEDNTNLDKAKQLLWPIKLKYGAGLSWGDLIILTGTTAIESMGGPSLGFCAGRIDARDGSESALLGPTAEQEAMLPCEVQGQCESPLGSTTIGLIYVNPEGPMGNPDPVGSSADVRSTFTRMAMNDSETVALIGGGHAFGKTHGACATPPGPPPKDNPVDPWHGNCGTGKGPDTFTSGFEGAWTLNPTQFDHSYFTELLHNNWSSAIGPGGHYQWHPDTEKAIMMLTSDISLLNDPSGEYQKWVHHFADDPADFTEAFAHAWYKLTTRDMGPVTRCVGPEVPPAQPFQFPLPPPPSSLPDFSAVRRAIRDVMNKPSNATAPDIVAGSATYAPMFVHLAFQCASTFRVTDYMGGCNGARIRFPPQSTWEANAGMDGVMNVLQPVKNSFGDSLTWADLIVLAGTVALEEGGVGPLPFCGGRSDARSTDPNPAMFLQQNGNMSASIADVRFTATLEGLSERELVALSARLRSPHQMARQGFANASFSSDSRVLNNTYFITLLENEWEPFVSPLGTKLQYRAVGQDLFATPYDLAIRGDPELLVIAQEFAQDNAAFLNAFGSAWTRLMNVDRFDGPTGNVCASPSAGGDSGSGNNPSPYLVASLAVATTAVLMGFVTVVLLKQQRARVRVQPLLD